MEPQRIQRLVVKRGDRPGTTREDIEEIPLEPDVRGIQLVTAAEGPA